MGCAFLLMSFSNTIVLFYVAAVMLGSTETTFYTIAVYFGSAGIVRTRHTVPAALAADLTGFLTAVLTVRLLFGP